MRRHAEPEPLPAARPRRRGATSAAEFKGPIRLDVAAIQRRTGADRAEVLRASRRAARVLRSILHLPTHAEADRIEARWKGAAIIEACARTLRVLGIAPRPRRARVLSTRAVSRWMESTFAGKDYFRPFEGFEVGP